MDGERKRKADLEHEQRRLENHKTSAGARIDEDCIITDYSSSSSSDECDSDSSSSWSESGNIIYEHFDKILDQQLLDHVKKGRNDEATAMLTKDLAQEFVDQKYHGTLLHHAAMYNNAVVARRLIELGADVHRSGVNCRNPLSIASSKAHADVTQVLLEAGARIDILNHDGSSALRLGLHFHRFQSKASKLLVSTLRAQARTCEELVERLIAAGCNMPHAAMLRDVEVMECMLKRGIDVNSRDPKKITALHVAVELKDLNMADWLVNKGVNVNALDKYDHSALLRSVERRDISMVTFLLEHGASPDIKGTNIGTPLYAAFMPSEDGLDEHLAELLLQHGASLLNCESLRRIFHSALIVSCDEAVKLLIAHMAMLEVLGEPVDKSVIHSVNVCYPAEMSELRKYYEPCQQVLAMKVFENWSLLDLLKESNRKIRLLVRKEGFLQEVEKICSQHKLSESYPYYYNTMMRRAEKAKQVVELENKAILVICKIFEANYNQFYDFANSVVEYLNERDLEHLIQV